MNRIAVIGAGYVGLTTAACLADLGNEVIAVDIDLEKVLSLSEGQVPFFEPGLKEILDRVVLAKRLSFTTSYGKALENAEYAFIAVATPETADGSADLTAIRSAARQIGESLQGDLIVINKSTVPIGTGDLVAAEIAQLNEKYQVDVASNPEFLREGSAISDFMHPNRIIIGARTRHAAEKIAELYAPLNARIMITDLASAEMVKYASNCFLATKISFINEIARICDRVGADIKTVSLGMGLDERIGPLFLDAGIGYGGSCLTKDVQALNALAEQYGYHPELLEAVADINRDQKLLVIDKLLECLLRLDGREIALLGLAFKPNTDDMRQAPSVVIANALLQHGCHLRAYDPVAMSKAALVLPQIVYSKDPYEAAEGADAVVLITEWNEFRHLDLARLRSIMRTPVLIDGRNIYEPSQAKLLGFIYRGIGRQAS